MLSSSEGFDLDRVEHFSALSKDSALDAYATKRYLIDAWMFASLQHLLFILNV